MKIILVLVPALSLLYIVIFSNSYKEYLGYTPFSVIFKVLLSLKVNWILGFPYSLIILKL